MSPPLRTSFLEEVERFRTTFYSEDRVLNLDPHNGSWLTLVFSPQLRKLRRACKMSTTGGDTPQGGDPPPLCQPQEQVEILPRSHSPASFCRVFETDVECR